MCEEVGFYGVASVPASWGHKATLFLLQETKELTLPEGLLCARRSAMPRPCEGEKREPPSTEVGGRCYNEMQQQLPSIGHLALPERYFNICDDFGMPVLFIHPTGTRRK